MIDDFDTPNRRAGHCPTCEELTGWDPINHEHYCTFCNWEGGSPVYTITKGAMERHEQRALYSRTKTGVPVAA